MPGQPSASSLTNYTFDVSSLVISETGTQPPSNIVDKNDSMTFEATCNFGGVGALGLVKVLADAGVKLQMIVKIEGWGTEPESSLSAALEPLTAGVTTYKVKKSLAAGTLPEGLYEVKAAVTLTGSASTFGIAGFNSIPTLQIITAAP